MIATAFVYVRKGVNGKYGIVCFGLTEMFILIHASFLESEPVGVGQVQKQTLGKVTLPDSLYVQDQKLSDLIKDANSCECQGIIVA